MNKNDKKKNLKEQGVDEYQVEMTPSAVSVGDAPDDSFQLVNKYGTYEIQPTAETENSFPTIAQGLPKHRKKPSTKQGAQRKKDSI